MDNFNVKEENGILVKEKINKDMMNLHSKTMFELNHAELQREIDYLWGQYDFVTRCDELSSDVKTKYAKSIWDKLDLMTKLFLFKNDEV